MKTLLTIVSMALLLVKAGNATSVLWNNGSAVSDSNHCDTQSSSCDLTGWAVADNFTLASSSTVTGFTYNDYIAWGSISDYSGTAWAIWSGNPFSSGTVVASGSQVGALSTGLAGSTLVTISGLNVGLSAGGYWLAIETGEANNGLWTRALASSSGAYKQWDGSATSLAGNYRNDLIGETAFTVLGDAASGVPEPATLTLVGFGLAALLYRRRL